MAMRYEVIFYQDEQGRVPVVQWLQGLRDGRAVMHVDRWIRRLAQGNFGDCKALHQGLFELRIDCGPGYRLYYCLDGLRIVILLCAGDKHTQTADIERARTYRLDYERRTR